MLFLVSYSQTLKGVIVWRILSLNPATSLSKEVSYSLCVALICACVQDQRQCREVR